MTKSLGATVFIPTYNGEAYIGDILGSLTKQKVDFDFEVLVIDSGSKDKTMSILNSYKKKLKNFVIKEIPNTEFGHGKTRNLAAELGRGEIIVYLSHDAIPAHDRWLHEITYPFKVSDEIVAVMGKQIPRPKCVPLLKYEINGVFKNFGSDSGTTLFYKDVFMENPVYRDSVTFYSDVNSAVRRNFILNVIPYRDVPYSEDQLLGRDIIDNGYVKAYAPRASVVHSNDLTLREYKHRIFDEIIGLRKIGTNVGRPSVKAVIKMTIVGVMRDTIRTVRDGEYSLKRKIFWLIANPFYHVEKWRGFRMATKVDLSDKDMINIHSLEARRSAKS